MTSRRDALAQQREDRLESMRHKTKGSSFGIHELTQSVLQNILLDHLLKAEQTKLRRFLVESKLPEWCRSHDDAKTYCKFFARCVHGTWNVSVIYTGGTFKFQFVHI